MADETPTEILYMCQVCDSVNLPATDLTWYFSGAEQRQPADELSIPAWYCTACVATREFHSGPNYKGPRLDIAIRDHERNKH